MIRFVFVCMHTYFNHPRAPCVRDFLKVNEIIHLAHADADFILQAIPKLCLISLFGAAVARLDLLGIFFLSAYGVLNVLSARNGNTTTARITWIVTAVYTSLYLAAQTVLQVIHQNFARFSTICTRNCGSLVP